MLFLLVICLNNFVVHWSEAPYEFSYLIRFSYAGSTLSCRITFDECIVKGKYLVLEGELMIGLNIFIYNYIFNNLNEWGQPKWLVLAESELRSWVRVSLGMTFFVYITYLYVYK
jgi:hypothetical protein